MTMIEIFPAFMIAAGVYVVSRIVNMAEESRNKKIQQREEDVRREKIATLYGRDT